MSPPIQNYDCNLGGVPTGDGGGDPCCVDVGFFAERYYTSQNLPNITETKIDTDLLIMANGRTDWSLATDNFTAPFNGRYSFDCSADVLTAAAGFVEIRMYQNAILRTNENFYAPFASTVMVGTQMTLWLTAGDTVDFRIYQATTATATLVSCSNQISGALIYDGS
jgi:hypothetical protein